MYSKMKSELIDQNVYFISKQAIFYWLPHRVYACRPWNARLYAAGQTRLSLPTLLPTSIHADICVTLPEFLCFSDRTED